MKAQGATDWAKRAYDEYVAQPIAGLSGYIEIEAGIPAADEYSRAPVSFLPSSAPVAPSSGASASDTVVSMANPVPPSNVDLSGVTRPVAPVFPEEREPTLTAEQLRENAEAIEHGEAPPNSEDLNDPFADLVIGTGTNDVFNIAVEGGQIYPITDAEKAIAAKAYLDNKYSTHRSLRPLSPLWRNRIYLASR